ncbi:MAG: hypothetical protein HC826_00985 [Rhodospirillales bacterium]|nr:hypothetical protein [Rhodospirillales bacterium]
MTSVTTNPLTASLLILHHGSLQEVLEFARSRNLIQLSDRPVYARSQFGEPDELSIKALTVAALLGLGTIQLLRGDILGPASQLFGLAWHMLQNSGGDGGAEEAGSVD